MGMKITINDDDHHHPLDHHHNNNANNRQPCVLFRKKFPSKCNLKHSAPHETLPH